VAKWTTTCFGTYWPSSGCRKFYKIPLRDLSLYFVTRYLNSERRYIWTRLLSDKSVWDLRWMKWLTFFLWALQVFPYQHNSTNASYSFIHLSPLLYRLLKLQKIPKTARISGLSWLMSYYADMAYHAPLFSCSIRLLLLAQRLNWKRNKAMERKIYTCKTFVTPAAIAQLNRVMGRKKIVPAHVVNACMRNRGKAPPIPNLGNRCPGR